jgi:hypothetical protein
MKKGLLLAVLTASLFVGLLAIFSLTAGAELRTFLVRLSTGSIITVSVDAPASVPMSAIPGLPGIPIQEITSHLPGPLHGGGGSGGGSGGGGGGGGSGGGGGKGKGSGGKHGSRGGGGSGKSGGPFSGSGNRQGNTHGGRAGNPGSQVNGHTGGRSNQPTTRLRNPDGSPTPKNPTFFDALPAPSSPSSVPNFVIRQFRVPIFLLPIYQAAGNQYGIRWEVLAAINEIESDYGRNLSVSTAGAVGWMQFLPSTWQTYGVDANGDGKRDPYNPVDAIFAAANYLKAAGGDKDIKRAIFAYNHATWYVDSVLLRAKLIAGVPGDLIGSLTGLTEGRFPVAAHARYADDMVERAMKARKVKAGQNAANVITDSAGRTSVDIFSSDNAPVVAVNDGVVKKIGSDKAHGRYLVLQDVYGNQYTYNGLGSVAKVYPVPKVDAKAAGSTAASQSGAGPAPTTAASGGRQPGDSGKSAAARASTAVRSVPSSHVVVKPIIFAHPARSAARVAGSMDQLFNETTTTAGLSHYDALFASVLGLNAKNAALKQLRPGAHVVAGTLLGRIGRPQAGKGPHVNFQIRPAGKGAPDIDPKPILDGWKLLESTAIYSANGKNALRGSSFSIGQILLLSKPLLEQRVLNDPRIDIYSGGVNDIKTHQIDRRVLATLEFLAESGLKPTVSALKSGHSDLTKTGNVSEHSSGNAVDISKINGIAILGHQDKGGIAEQTVRRLMTLQGTMRPHQIISLLSLGGNTLSMADHADHVHVGFHPLFGVNAKLGQEAAVVLKPGQWTNLIARLRQLSNPAVPTSPSKFALPASGHK